MELEIKVRGELTLKPSLELVEIINRFAGAVGIQVLNHEPATSENVLTPNAETQIKEPDFVPGQAAGRAPTAAPSYSLPQLRAAAAGLSDQGKKEGVKALLSQFSVSSLSKLREDQFVEFAAGLRDLGGAI